MGLRGSTARWGLRRLLRTGGVTAGIVEDLHRREWSARAIRRVRLSRVRPFRLAGTRWRLPEPPSMTAVPNFATPDTDYPEWPSAAAPRTDLAAPTWSAGSPGAAASSGPGGPPGSAWRDRATGPTWPTPSLHDIRTAAAHPARAAAARTIAAREAAAREAAEGEAARDVAASETTRDGWADNGAAGEAQASEAAREELAYDTVDLISSATDHTAISRAADDRTREDHIADDRTAIEARTNPDLAAAEADAADRVEWSAPNPPASGAMATIQDTDGVSRNVTNDGPDGVAGGAVAPTTDIRHVEASNQRRT